MKITKPLRILCTQKFDQKASIAFEYILVTLFAITISILVLRYSKELIIEKLQSITSKLGDVSSQNLPDDFDQELDFSDLDDF